MPGVPMPTRGPCYSRQLRPPQLQGVPSNVHQKDEDVDTLTARHPLSPLT